MWRSASPCDEAAAAMYLKAKKWDKAIALIGKNDWKAGAYIRPLLSST
jgi:hypothetical protein